MGSNTFIYYRQFDSSKRIAPDIYVLPGVAQASIARSWKLWELAAPLSFALEVVSLDVDKDYVVAPDIHERIGTKELVIFDPECAGDRDRCLWQVYRRTRGGNLRLCERTGADRVRCRELGAFLRVVGGGAALRVRVATGARGAVLFPTEAEVERAATERERAAKLALAAELESVKSELARLQGAGRGRSGR